MPDNFEFDASEFVKGLHLGDERVKAAATKGMKESLLDLERRCKERCPVDQGVLMRSIHADVDGVKVTDDSIEGVVATGAEASDYAIIQHEEPFHHTHPVDGTYAAKYIEGPLKENGPKYVAAIAEDIRGAMGN